MSWMTGKSKEDGPVPDTNGDNGSDASGGGGRPGMKKKLSKGDEKWKKAQLIAKREQEQEQEEQGLETTQNNSTTDSRFAQNRGNADGATRKGNNGNLACPIEGKLLNPKLHAGISARELKDLFADRYAAMNAEGDDNDELGEHKEWEIRLCTYNVHNWHAYRDVSGRIRTDEMIASVIKRIDADVICLNEVSNPGKYLKDTYEHIYYGELRFAGEGNAICSKFPLMNCETVVYKDGTRNMLYAEIQPTVETKIGIISTHLDVYDETSLRRKEELEQLNRFVVSKDVNNIICMGDMNAMLREDYSKHHWDWIVKNDENRDVVTTTEALEKFVNDYGWKDVFKVSEQVQGREKPPNFKPPCVTVWSFRRIDHVFLRDSWDLTISNATIVYNAASDHLPVVVDIDITR